ncbi:MAG: MarR family transcriptional regulator [Eubacteriales bacterium]|nr:MarR family transcriptional regulator [Eubacteriales bacterium]
MVEKARGEEKKERSLQSMVLEISRRYVGKCFGQMKETGIYPGQVPILAVLHQKGGYSQKELAELLKVKAPTVTVSIQRLEKAGLVCRRQDERDQRVTRIYMTEKGEDVVTEGLRRMHEIEKAVFGGFSQAEICLMKRFFSQILENIDGLSDIPEEEMSLMPGKRR